MDPLSVGFRKMLVLVNERVWIIPFNDIIIVLFLKLKSTHVLGLPAATEGRLFRNILHVDHVHHLGLMLPDLVVAATAALGRAISPSRRTKGQITGVTDTGHHNGGWDQGQPILDCK